MSYLLQKPDVFVTNPLHIRPVAERSRSRDTHCSFMAGFGSAQPPKGL